MSMSDLLGIGGLLALLAFIVFAFRQGMNVKPSGNDPDEGLKYFGQRWTGGDSGGSH